jgi:hypothetical protein
MEVNIFSLAGKTRNDPFTGVGRFERGSEGRFLMAHNRRIPFFNWKMPLICIPLLVCLMVLFAQLVHPPEIWG